MKKILETIIGLVCIFSLFLAGAQHPDGSMNVWWTISCLAIAVVCGFIWNKMQSSPFHIPNEAYDDLNEEIKHFAHQVEDNVDLRIGFKIDFQDGYYLQIHVLFSAKTTKSKFTDDAWGVVRTFTETNWSCKCEITSVQVFNRKGREVKSDFDEGRLELEFESTQWS